MTISITKQTFNIPFFSRCPPGGGKSKPQASVPSFRFHKSGDHAEVSEVHDSESLACSGHVFNLGETSIFFFFRVCLVIGKYCIFYYVHQTILYIITIFTTSLLNICPCVQVDLNPYSKLWLNSQGSGLSISSLTFYFRCSYSNQISSLQPALLFMTMTYTYHQES